MICVPENNSKAARAITRTETHDGTEHDTNFNHKCRQLCGTMSWTAGLMEDNTAKREKKEAEESEDSRHDEKKKRFRGAPRLHATCQICGAQSTNFNTMIVTRISAMSVAWNTLHTDIKEVHPCRITANAVGYEVHRCASNGVTDQLQTSKNSRARRTNMRKRTVRHVLIGYETLRTFVDGELESIDPRKKETQSFLVTQATRSQITEAKRFVKTGLTCHAANVQR